MSKLIILTFISFIQIALINSQETYDEKNDNKKSSTIWTTQALLDYALKHHGKDKYFICDPLGYISEDEKEVIYYRIEAIYNKLNITTVFFVLDKISLEGLNITDEEWKKMKKKGKENSKYILLKLKRNYLIEKYLLKKKVKVWSEYLLLKI